VISLAATGLTKTFEDAQRGTVTVFEDLTLTFEAGAFSTVMGPSGCGKTTLLNVFAGLVEPDAGRVSVDGERVEPGDFSFAYVFQEPRLLDWKTVGENVAFALRASGVPESERDAIVDDVLALVGLREEIDTYPLRLSGGMRQRVGLARALAVEPDVLLMDEPFSELDELTARRLRDDLLDLWQETGKTIVFVTHDVGEAVFLSDAVYFLNERGELFEEATVPVGRPRTFGDPDLDEVERQLTETFFENVTNRV